MSAVLHLIEQLKQAAVGRIPAGSYFFTPLEEGLPKGALVEISGPAGGGKTEMVLRFLAENPQARVAWIEDEMTIYPGAFPQHRVSLERVLFVESSFKQAIWTSYQILRSHIFGVVVLKVESITEMELRRLQLLAEKYQTTVILVNDEALKGGVWPISVRLRVTRSSEFMDAPGVLMMDVLKYKGQKSWQVRVG